MKDTANAFIETVTLKGAPDGPLAGLSFGVKDLYDVAGRVAGCGNPEWKQTHLKAEAHAPAVQALLDAGGTCMGMTHTDELAYSLMGVNAHYGTPVNSADPRRVPGGSSSGSAAAVAAGLVDFALGSDTGGSVRLPASFCGVWGLRTSFGHVSLDGAMPFTHSFDTAGWFARDAATMDKVAQAYGLAEGTAPRRLLLPVDLWARADAATIDAIAPALAKLEAALGPARPVRISDEGLEAWRETFRICQAHEIWQVHGDWISQHDPDFGPGIKERFEIASKIADEDAAREQAEKRRIAAHIRTLVPAGDVLVLPTSPGPAPFVTDPEEALNSFRMAAFEMLCVAGLSGLPQLSVPAGQVDEGPVGLSLIGAEGEDRALISLAGTLDRAA
ncbi:amidase [Roseovarius aestuariivivens]|uniref:amidase n=1 Tax=Roseovarius aestuariivivens TaxID=1888910 RepID=UPI001080F2F0|nr:amidase [Roseovarius aestuariivivens]